MEDSTVLSKAIIYWTITFTLCDIHHSLLSTGESSKLYWSGPLFTGQSSQTTLLGLYPWKVPRLLICCHCTNTVLDHHLLFKP